MIISILNQKGGVGKTTLSINLASAFKFLKYSVLLVDSDPQGSARDWHANNDGTVLDIVGLDRPTLDKDVQKFKGQYDFIIIDGAPHLSSMATRAILCSDLVLVPVQPSPYDVWASADLVELIKQRQEIADGKPRAAFVISRKVVNTILSRDVRVALKDYELPVLNASTTQRMTYASSAACGETVLKTETPATIEIKEIALEIIEFMRTN